MAEPGLSARLWQAAPILLACANLFWAGNFVLARSVATTPGGLDPIGLAFWRWVLALALILPVGGRIAWRERRVLRAHLPILTLYAALSVSLYNTLVYVGLRETTAVNALLLQSTMPILVMLVGFALFHDRIGFWQVLGVLLSLAGVLVVLAKGSFGGLADFRIGRGELTVLLGVLANAVYFTTLRKRPPLHPLAFLTAIFTIGVVLLVPAWLVWSTPMHRAIAPSDLLQVGYLALCASILALLFFNRGVALIGANRASAYLHLMPVTGSVLSVLFLGEAFRGYHLAGIALVFAGLWLSSRPLRA